MFKFKKNINSVVLLASAILALSFARLIPHPWNFSPMIAAGIFAGFYFRHFYLGSFVIILSMFLGDLFLGFHNTMFFTYLSLAIVVLVGLYLKNLKFTNILYGTLASSIVFFIITNLGAWLTLEMYSKDINGLVQSYTMAIPFFHNTLISTFVYLYIFKTLFEFALKKKILKNSF
tara:strand:+ start:660 stop:1184 length:525 start_codon:yes stop_codon:yes gene_type:complete